MPRFHSVSHYHSQPSIKQSPGSNMSPLPLLHLNPRTSPLKSRPSTPVHFQNPACQSIKPRRSAPEHSNRPKPKSGPRPDSATSTRPKRPPHSCDDSLLAAPIQATTPALPPTHSSNRKAHPKRTRKPRESTTSPPVSHLYNLSLPEPHKRSHDIPDRTMNPSPTPRNSESALKPQVLSLTQFCDQLTAEVHDQSFETNPDCSRKSKKKSLNRRSKKAGQRRAPMCTELSDSEDVLTFDHSIFLTHGCPSRSATPIPTKPVETPTPNGSPLVLDDTDGADSSTATLPSARLSDSPASSPTRQHLRARSVASIFDVEKLPVKSEQRCAKDDWDMPPSAPPRALTWQQKDKKADKTVSSTATDSQLSQRIDQHDTRAPSGAPAPNLKETHTRRQRSALARTSSASTLSRPSVSTAKSSQSHSPRSDDESAMTWQQSILRPSLRHTLLNSRSDQSVNTEVKSCSKKNAASIGMKMPVKANCIPRKAIVTSAAKPRTVGPSPPSNNRRNSLSTPRTSTAKTLKNSPIHEKSRSLGLKSGDNVFSEWKSFNTSPEKSAQPIFSSPLSILGAQADPNTPLRRHAKSHTHQPVGSPNSFAQPFGNSAPFSLHIPDSKDTKVSGPSKPRSTSEDVFLSTPVQKLSSPALRAAFMYAGPQFHNSPCPAALPAPKFSFGSA